MPDIIISYRRSDSDVFAGRVRDRIASHYGETSVFIDVDDIPFGRDFRVHIQEALSECDTLVVIIGRKWLGAGKRGQFRINDGADPVRIEVETALTNAIPIVPILVGKTRMPSPEQLPQSLKNFAFINAAPVDTGHDFHRDMDRVIGSIDAFLAPGTSHGREDVAAGSSQVASDLSLSSVRPTEPAIAQTQDNPTEKRCLRQRRLYPT